MDEQRWFLIFNPFSGGKPRKKDKVLSRIHKALEDMRISFDTVETEAPGDARKKVKQAILNQGRRKILVAGGDGTIHEVVNGIFDAEPGVRAQDITLGCIPVGSSNDWVKTVDIPTDIEAAARALKLGHYFFQDVGIIEFEGENGPELRHFVNIAGIGFDAEVVKSMQARSRKGQPSGSWQKHIFKNLGRYHSAPMRIYVDGELWEETKVFSIAAGICRYNGNGMIPLPEALPDDGELDLTLIRAISPIQVLLHKSKMYDGSFTSLPFINQAQGHTFRFESDVPVSVEADGELLGMLPATISLRHRNLRIISTLKNRSE